jgi:deltex-like protein
MAATSMTCEALTAVAGNDYFDDYYSSEYERWEDHFYGTCHAKVKKAGRMSRRTKAQKAQRTRATPSSLTTSSASIPTTSAIKRHLTWRTTSAFGLNPDQEEEEEVAVTSDVRKKGRKKGNKRHCGYGQTKARKNKSSKRASSEEQPSYAERFQVGTKKCWCGKPQSRSCKQGTCKGADQLQWEPMKEEIHVQSHNDEAGNSTVTIPITVPASEQLCNDAITTSPLQIVRTKHSAMSWQQRCQQRQTRKEKWIQGLSKAVQKYTQVQEQLEARGTTREQRIAKHISRFGGHSSTFGQPPLSTVSATNCVQRKQQERTWRHCSVVWRDAAPPLRRAGCTVSRDKATCILPREPSLVSLSVGVGQLWFSQTASKSIGQIVASATKLDAADVERDVTCPVCFTAAHDIDDTGNWIQLPTCMSPHPFHAECITHALRFSQKCPVCTISCTGTVPTGPMPLGTMSVQASLTSSYITIRFDLASGIQDHRHPNPGQYFSGTSRVAYLPNTPHGWEVLGMMQQAWDYKHMFRVGTSITTGQSNTVVWNDIHCKTSLCGGAFGFPDAGYLDRVTEELRDVGIVSMYS